MKKEMTVYIRRNSNEVRKLNNELLKSIVFNNITYKREEIMVRAGIGEDCAVIDFGEFACVISH